MQLCGHEHLSRDDAGHGRASLRPSPGQSAAHARRQALCPRLGRAPTQLNSARLDSFRLNSTQALCPRLGHARGGARRRAAHGTPATHHHSKPPLPTWQRLSTAPNALDASRLPRMHWMVVAGLVTSVRPDLQLTLIEHVAHLTAADYAKVLLAPSALSNHRCHHTRRRRPRPRCRRTFTPRRSPCSPYLGFDLTWLA